MVRGIANSKIGFGDLILLLRYFFKLKVSTHPNLYRLPSSSRAYPLALEKKAEAYQKFFKEIGFL
ncbi:hypothetical protein AST19_18975 [Acinetobacter baumannii]|nr:hypothetical protein [Acinetobacter baumannii]OUM77238.1 hypothetical protein AST19_18975 [Acinetobacter baumannii]QBY91260.1 hypothetical protein E5D09_00645 [Acinetobacter baumannii]TLT60032.1 hypothetical protein FD887_20195 [Acinetobacter baumannii]